MSPYKPLRPCSHPGCRELTSERFCPAHKKAEQQYIDRQRGSANKRGYTYKWQKYAKWFLKQPGNQICRLKLSTSCSIVANCVDHIQPPSGPDDPLFWDDGNHQAACLHCNSVKGRRTLRGTGWEV